MGQQLGALSALMENLGLVPHQRTPNCLLTQVLGVLILSSALHEYLPACGAHKLILVH